MTSKEANEQVQPVSIIPKEGSLQPESPVSETVQHFALGEEELGLGQWLRLSPPGMPSLLSLLLLFFAPQREKRRP